MFRAAGVNKWHYSCKDEMHYSVALNSIAYKCVKFDLISALIFLFYTKIVILRTYYQVALTHSHFGSMNNLCIIVCVMLVNLPTNILIYLRDEYLDYLSLITVFREF